jgi:hypothetical protein
MIRQKRNIEMKYEECKINNIVQTVVMLVHKWRWKDYIDRKGEERRPRIAWKYKLSGHILTVQPQDIGKKVEASRALNCLIHKTRRRSINTFNYADVIFLRKNQCREQFYQNTEYQKPNSETIIHNNTDEYPNL